MESKGNQLSEKSNRDILKELSNAVAEIMEVKGYTTVNEAVINEFYRKNGHEEFKKFNEWRNSGYKILKGSKAFVVWGRPTQGLKVNKQEDAEVFDMFPLCFLFSNKQVQER